MPIDLEEFHRDFLTVQYLKHLKRKEVNMLELSSRINFLTIYDFSKYLTLNNISNKVEHDQDPINGNWEEYRIVFT